MKYYAVKHIDKSVVANSRSGGVFTALSDLILEEGGKVYGCVLDDDLNVIHVGTSDVYIRNKMRGSKYVQSSIKDCYNEVKDDLERNVNVLFSGTPCQVAGLKCFLQKDYSNLLCVDIICQGVPSPKIYRSYIKSYGNVSGIDFRNKRDFGWRDHIETLKVKDEMIHSRVWTNIFYGKNALRPSCYKCRFKSESVSRYGDITIGDFWGIEKVYPELDDDDGVSLVIVDTPKGEYFFDCIRNSIIYKETIYESCVQKTLVRPEEKPKTREMFWRDYTSKHFKLFIWKYGGAPPGLIKCIIKGMQYIKRIKVNDSDTTE